MGDRTIRLDVDRDDLVFLDGRWVPGVHSLDLVHHGFRHFARESSAIKISRVSRANNLLWGGDCCSSKPSGFKRT